MQTNTSQRRWYKVRSGFADTADGAAALSEQRASALRTLGATDVVAMAPVEITDAYWESTCRFRATRAVMSLYVNTSME